MNHNKEAGNFTPPFPEAMTFREMLTNIFNVDFMSASELGMICDAGEMYANGCLTQERKVTPPSLSIEQEGEAYGIEHAKYMHWQGREVVTNAYLAAATPRQKQIEELKQDLNDRVASYNVLKAASDIAVRELEGKLNIAREAHTTDTEGQKGGGC